MPVIDLSTAASDIVGAGSGGPSYVFNAVDYGLTHAASGDAQASTNVTALNAWAAAMLASRNLLTAGVIGVIPPGRYVVNDVCTLPDLAGGQPLTIHADGARFRFAAGTTNKTMFKTGMPTDATDAETKNGLRDMWRWRGGSFYGLNGVGTRAFEWNAASRLNQSDVQVIGFEEGIRTRFALHYRLQNSLIQACNSYGVRLEYESGDWTSGTASNAAGHGAVIDHVRFYGKAGQAAQLRIANLGHTVQNCTFEGESPVVNIDYHSGNTSQLWSKAVNLHVENNPSTAHVQIDTIHGYGVDFQYINSSSLYVKVLASSYIEIGHAGWPTMGPAGGGPFFEVPNPVGDGVWSFRGTGRAGQFDASNSTIWKDGRQPAGLYAGAVFDDKKARLYLSPDDYLNVVAGVLQFNGTPI